MQWVEKIVLLKLKRAEIFQKENTDTLITLFGDENIKSQLKINSINLRNYKIENTLIM